MIFVWTGTTLTVYGTKNLKKLLFVLPVTKFSNKSKYQRSELKMKFLSLKNLRKHFRKNQNKTFSKRNQTIAEDSIKILDEKLNEESIIFI